MSIPEERIFVARRTFSGLGPDVKPYILVPSRYNDDDVSDSRIRP